MLKIKTLISVAAAAMFLVPTVAQADKPIVIKVGTLAPANSPWGRVFKRAAKEVQSATNGAVKIKVYPGGQRGDEKVMVRKMKSGQLQGAAITSVGLAQISKEILVLQAPGLIRSNKQLDCVRGKLADRFEKSLAAKGFTLLGWGDVGKTYLMGGSQIKDPSDLKNAKPWVWESDPVFGSLYRLAGAKATPLTVPDVLQGLSNSVIDTIYSSPVATTSLQWHPHVKYINAKLISVGVGATLVTQKAWDQATPEQKETIRAITAKWHDVLKAKVRSMNSKALKTLKGQGAVIVKGDSGKWNALFKRVQEDLVGKIYSRSLLDEARRHAKACK